MNNSRRKMRNYLILIITSSLLILTLVFFSFYFLNKNLTTTFILTILSIVLLYLVLKFNQSFEYYKNEYNFMSLIKNKEKSFTLKKGILNGNFHTYLLKDLNYKTYINNNNYTLYYKIDDGINDKRKNKTLYALLIIKKDISFIDKSLNKLFEELELSLSKKERFTNRVFFQFKLYKNLNNKLILDADKIFFIKYKRSSVVLLNVLYNPNNNEIYYLHSNKFKTLHYLDFAFNKLNQLINYKK